MFLADAVAAYVESLTERELDAPFMAMLRSHGYTHVHLVHGPYEFGRDIVAQRLEDEGMVQYCFQTKAGDMGARAWREVAKQVDTMRTVEVAHPAFDPGLPRRLVVVVNGRLKGGAGVEAQSYIDYHAKRAEAPTLVWDLDTLTDLFMTVLSDGVAVRERSRTLELLGRLGTGAAGRQDVREYARAWFTRGASRTDRWVNALTAAMLAKEAAAAGREDLARQVAFLLMRSAREVPRVPKPEREAISTFAVELFAQFGLEFWEQVSGKSPVDLTMVAQDQTGSFALHRVRVHRLAEGLALVALHDAISGSGDQARLITDYLCDLIHGTDALSQPISDEWSYSLLVAGLLLWRMGRLDELEHVLRTAAVWLLDRVEAGDGLAAAGSLPEVELRHLLGEPYPALRAGKKPQAYAFTVVLDLAWLAGLSDLYGDLLNDLHAVGAMATTVVGGPHDAELIARVKYEPWGAKAPASHHEKSRWPRKKATPQEAFAQLGVWATLRDRHAPHMLAALASPTPPTTTTRESTAPL